MIRYLPAILTLTSLCYLQQFVATASADSYPAHLKCEYVENPVGIDTSKPRFSWEVESRRRAEHQTAYQILVASSRAKLDSDEADKWDSGKVASSQSVNIVYEGSPLNSRESCYWKVRLWDRDGNPSASSRVACFEMGLLSPQDWTANWIALRPQIESVAENQGKAPNCDENRRADRDLYERRLKLSSESPLLRTEFNIQKEIRRARIAISGLGWFELYVNGQRVGNHVLDPVMSNYNKQVYYVTHDLADYLTPGRNAIGVMLGNGWYSQPRTNRYGDAPVLIAQMDLEYADGSTDTVVTDGKWKAATGPITANAIQHGEEYDARLEKPGWAIAGYDDSTWSAAELVSGPSGVMCSQLLPPIRVVETRTPVKLTEPQSGVFVFDFGQVFGGWSRLHVKGDAGTKVTLRYSERLMPESGLVDKRNHPTPLQTDTYTLKGDSAGEEYEPRFTFHPVRFVQIEGYPGKPTLNDLVGQVVHSDVDLAGGFQCSNAQLNRIAHLSDWTTKSSWYGMPLDCLHREPFPYLEPAETPSHLYARKFMPQFWMKWLGDIASEQRADGTIPVVVPDYVEHISIDPAWIGNYPIAVWYLSQYYDDNRILEDHYEGMKRLIEHFQSIAEGNLISKGTWGDHMSPGDKPGEEHYLSPLSPSPFLWTGFYYRDVRVLSQVASVLGKKDDAQRYAKLADEIKSAMNAKWFDAEHANYNGGSQTSNAFALALGIVPEDKRDAVQKNLIHDLVDTHQGRMTMGIIGLTSVVESMADYGEGNVFLDVLNRKEYPGWGYMIAQGATTLWESWGQIIPNMTRGREECMAMFSTVQEFLYSDVAGIHGPDYLGSGTMAGGFAEVRIRPLALGDLTHAQASIKTVRGLVASSWQRKGNAFNLKASIPGNARAKVSLPTLGRKDIVVTEGGTTVWRKENYVSGVEGVSGAKSENNFITFEVGSGNYTFHLSGR